MGFNSAFKELKNLWRTVKKRKEIKGSIKPVQTGQCAALFGNDK